jgi:aspartyl-tRNA(Asn)/glutamyl-tRNA(Gln) amidotransferase subunit A
MMKTFESIKAGLASGSASCEAVTSEYLKAIENGSKLNAFLSVFGEKAIAQARQVDARRKSGTAGPLAGMVVSIKDVLCVKDEKVTCGSRILGSFVAPYDATVVRNSVKRTRSSSARPTWMNLPWVLPRRILPSGA